MILDTPTVLKSKLGLGKYENFYPNTFIVSPKKEDYNRGYITRYFVSNINYDSIIETDAKSYNFAENTFYRKVKMDWKITGPEYSIYRGKMLEITGVIPHNVIRIENAKKVMPNVETVVNNPKQFWRGY